MTKSILTDDLDYCIICGRPRTDIHHVINGTANRKKSEAFGLIIPLCRKHHEMIHTNQVIDILWKQKAQIQFEKLYGHDMWMETFHKNYLWKEQMTQQERVLNHLKKYDSLSQLEATEKYRITRLSAIIKNLRDHGYTIITDMKRGKNRYGERINYGEYRLIEDGDYIEKD